MSKVPARQSPSPSHKSSYYVPIPDHRSMKNLAEDSVPGRQRELIAKAQIDHIASRIAEETNRFKDAKKLVKVVNRNKQVPLEVERHK